MHGTRQQRSVARPTVSPLHSPRKHLSAKDWARLQALNAHWNEDIVKHRAGVLEIYGPLVKRTSKKSIRVTRDVAYGGHERQSLDIFTTASAQARPVILFVHGGAFTRGAKSVDGEIYDNVLYWFARQGFIGVNVEYRLAPGAQYPAGAEDVSLAVEWVAARIQDYGGDPSRLVLMGHSAGGCHVASYLLDPDAGTTPHAAIKAAVLISARLRLETLPANPNAKNVAVYCGDDPALLDRRSPVNHVARCRWPIFVGIAEYENRYLDAYGLEFASRLALAGGHDYRFVQMLGHNHTSIVAHFNTAEDWLGRQILDFLNGT